MDTARTPRKRGRPPKPGGPIPKSVRQSEYMAGLAAEGLVVAKIIVPVSQVDEFRALAKERVAEHRKARKAPALRVSEPMKNTHVLHLRTATGVVSHPVRVVASAGDSLQIVPFERIPWIGGRWLEAGEGAWVPAGAVETPA